MVLNIKTIVRPINDTIELSQMYPQNTLNFSLFLLYVTKIIYLFHYSTKAPYGTFHTSNFTFQVVKITLLWASELKTLPTAHCNYVAICNL